MPSFTRDPFVTPFGRNVFLRSTQDVKTESGLVIADTVPDQQIDGSAQKVLQPGTVLARITSGVHAGMLGPFMAAGTDEVQTVTVTGTPTGGTFTLTYDGETTTALAHSATAAAIVAALEALPNVGAGGVTGGGGALPGTPVTITFAAVSGNPPQMTADGALLTGGTTPTVTVTTSTPGTGATDGRQTLANIVGLNNTFLPWQLLHRDVEVAYIYEAAVVQSRCLEYNAQGVAIALTNTTAAAMFALKSLDIRFK